MNTEDWDEGYKQGYEDAELEAREEWEPQVNELLVDSNNYRTVLEEALDTLRTLVYDIENVL
jgi:flagellar biosynthesis/type III secretory pathway protein FliH